MERDSIDLRRVGHLRPGDTVADYVVQPFIDFKFTRDPGGHLVRGGFDFAQNTTGLLLKEPDGPLVGIVANPSYLVSDLLYMLARGISAGPAEV